MEKSGHAVRVMQMTPVKRVPYFEAGVKDIICTGQMPAVLTKGPLLPGHPFQLSSVRDQVGPGERHLRADARRVQQMP